MCCCVSIERENGIGGGDCECEGKDNGGNDKTCSELAYLCDVT